MIAAKSGKWQQQLKATQFVSGTANQAFPRPRPRRARGQDRPTYLSPDLDRVVIMMTSLMGEVSALRDRVDTHEALAEQGIVATSEAIENYSLDSERRAQREARRDAMLNRFLRVVYEERDGDAPNDPVAESK